MLSKLREITTVISMLFVIILWYICIFKFCVGCISKMFFGAPGYMTSGNLFRTLLEIEVSRIQPRAAKGRSRQLHFDEAFDCILRAVRAGMQTVSSALCAQVCRLYPPRCVHRYAVAAAAATHGVAHHNFQNNIYLDATPRV